MDDDDTSELGSDPLADLVYPLFIEGGKLKIIHTALKLGIFDKIESLENNVTIEKIADKFGYRPQELGRFLNILVSMKLLQMECGVYSLPESCKKYLLSDSPFSMVKGLLFAYEVILPRSEHLPDILNYGKGNHGGIYDRLTQNKPKSSPNEPDGRKSNPQVHNSEGVGVNSRLEDFISMMDSSLSTVLPALTRSFDFSRYNTLVDIGGCSGYLAYEFVTVYDTMTAIVYDLPAVVEFALNKQPEITKDKVQFVAGDFLKDEELPEGDMLVLSHILHNLEDDNIDILMKKVCNAISSGGCILVTEKCLNDDKTGPEDAIMMDFVTMTISEGRERTLTEYQILLEHYGFIDVQFKEIHGRNNRDIIMAFKP